MNAGEYAEYQKLVARVTALEADREALLGEVADLVAQVAGAHAAVVQLTADLRGMPRFALKMPPARELSAKLALMLKKKDWRVEVPVDTGVPEMKKRPLRGRPPKKKEEAA